MKELLLKFISMLSPVAFNPTPLPDRFFGLKLVKRLSRTSSKFVIGLYSNRKDQKFVAKFWSGHRSDTSYYLLQREISFLKFVRTHLSQTGQFIFPVFVQSHETSNRLVLVTKYFPGRWGGNYDSAVSFLEKLPLDLPVPTRSRLYFIMVYPLIFVIAVFRHPHQFMMFIRSLLVFFFRSPSLFGNHKLVFVHGDLHPKNILTNNKQCLILDTEQSMYTYPEFELATTLASPNLSYKTKTRLLHKLPTNHRVLFSVLGIFCAIYNLCGQASLPQEKSFFNLLDLCLR